MNNARRRLATFLTGAVALLLLLLIVAGAKAATIYVTMQPPSSGVTTVLPGATRQANGTFIVTEQSTVLALLSLGWTTVTSATEALRACWI